MSMSVSDHSMMKYRGRYRSARFLRAMALLAILPVQSATAQICTQAPPGLVSWWPGEGSAFDIIGGNTGAVGVGVTFAPGMVGQAFSFNGASSVAVANSPSLLLGSGEITIDAWINAPPFNGVNDVRTIVGKSNLSFPYQLYVLRVRGDNRVEFVASDCSTGACGWSDAALGDAGGTKQAVRSVSVVADNTWHHVAGIRRANGMREIYVDGVLENTRSEAMWNTDSNSPLYIGEMNGSGNYRFTRPVCELENSNSALSASEIQAIYNAGSAGQCRGLLVFPNHGGNAGSVTSTIFGSGFQPAATVKLTGLGADIVGTNTTVANASVLTTTFNLSGATPGARTVVVTNADNTSVTLPGGFTVEQGGAPQIWVDIIGRDKIRIGSEQAYYIVVGNSGNLNVYDAMVFINVPSGLTVSVNNLLPPIAPTDPSLAIGASTLIPVWIYAVPAGSSGIVELNLTVPSGVTTDGFISASLTTSPTAPFSNTGDFGSVPANLDLLAQSIVTTLHGPKPGTTSSALASANLPVAGSVLQASDVCPDELLYTDAQAWQDCENRYQQSIINNLHSIQNINNPSSYGKGTTINILGNLQPPIGPGVSIFSAIMTFFQLHALQDIANNVFASRTYHPVTSSDPNDKAGAQGVGTQQYISGATPLRYSVYFGNEVTATAPAQQVSITDQLDTTHDSVGTLSLGPISFGNQLVTPPLFKTSFSTTVDLRPATNLLVAVNANLNPTGLLTWTFQSPDPATRLPPTDPTVGFLPPGGNSSVFFTVNPKPGLPTNTQIQNQATIVFDVNAPISTPTWLNTLDSTPPTSHVLALPSTESSA